MQGMYATAQGRDDRTIRAWFRIVVGLLCLALVAFAVWSFFADRGADEARLKREASLLARALSQHASDMMSVIDLLQFEMVGTVRHVRSGDVDTAQATEEWRERLAHIDAIEAICAFDRSGQILLTTSSDCARAPKLGWFKPYPAIGGTIRQVGLPFQTQDGHTWLIPVLHTWYDERARPAGIVVVMIRSAYMSSFYTNYDMNGQSGISLYRADGVLLSRFPYLDDQIGRNFSGSSILRPAFSQVSGLTSGVSPIDGVERIRAFHRVPNSALIIVVGLGSSALPVWNKTGIASFVLVAFLIFLVVRVTHQLDRHLATNSDTREIMKIQARTDALTGLPNRRAFDEAFAREWRAADQNFTSLSMLLFDVDNFKTFNDTYGHQAGDECLRRVAFALRQGSFETIGHLARYGGEEFALLLIDVTPAVATLVAKHLRAQIEAMGIPHAGNGTVGVVTLSIGVSTLDFAAPLGLATPANLVAEADQALYEAKRAGRNRVQSFDRHMAAPDVVALRA